MGELQVEGLQAGHVAQQGEGHVRPPAPCGTPSKKGGGGGELRALRRVEALPQCPISEAWTVVNASNASNAFYESNSLNASNASYPSNDSNASSSPRPSTPASGKSALSAPRGACNRPPCRRGAPRIVEGPQVPGGQVTRAASSARDAIGTNEKNQQTENGQTTEPQLVSAIRSKRVSE